MDAEEFDYYFKHGEFMPISSKKVKEARNDPSIERPARHISMTDGYAEKAEQAEASQEAPAEAPKADAEAQDQQKEE